MEMMVVTRKKRQQAMIARVRKINCQFQRRICWSSVDAAASGCCSKESIRWWASSAAIDLLQSISIEFMGRHTVSRCFWQGLMTIWWRLHFVQGTHSSISTSQYSWCLHDTLADVKVGIKSIIDNANRSLVRCNA